MPDLRVLLLMVLLAGSARAEAACTDAFHRSVESRLGTGDAQGHGPDVGSPEWKSAVEFKLGLRGRADVPRRDSQAWCRYIDERLTECSRSSARRAAGQGPSSSRLRQRALRS
ncbi:hypothetical protein [Ramlibacter rhizophilus]|uniref:Secreted protein n=1 Tax=Ramlibacter rhizophilus TaxID=1781167 RepID=A0A4Z0BH12_9BURK|nr:hypothetical protein [Ramlibacter rhizophilus]TFY98582.1 hypothetical protein EZ242_13685 [Ramlibacter rhizophilus]